MKAELSTPQGKHYQAYTFFPQSKGNCGKGVQQLPPELVVQFFKYANSAQVVYASLHGMAVQYCNTCLTYDRHGARIKGAFQQVKLIKLISP